MDLFIEKPLSDSIKGVETLRKIVKQKKLVIQMGYHLRFHQCIIKIRKLIKQKKIGKIISIQAENGSYLPDWHPYENYRRGYAGKKELGGGIVLTQIHDVDYLYWFFGNPKSIFSVMGKFSDLDISVEDYSASIIQFKNKITAELHLDFFQPPEFRGCKIKATNGIISWNSLDNQVKLYNNKKRKWEVVFRAKNFITAIGREPEISRVIQILSRRTKNNPVLMGEPGVGKTAIVEGLAQRISSGPVSYTHLTLPTNREV